ncbi:protein of unknown function [Hyphomicrobium sp. MC1]|nr:protein of unknown function [Hyphomicrobium sp. MC1]
MCLAHSAPSAPPGRTPATKLSIAGLTNIIARPNSVGLFRAMMSEPLRVTAAAAVFPHTRNPC